MENIEVEVQSFITKEKYDELLEFFNENARPLGEDFQETHYLDENSNFRIQKGKNSAKLWHKSGNVHDEFMEEIEIPINKGDFEKLEKLLGKVGHKAIIKWLRHRKEFDWNNIKVSLDFTKGYGYIIELEKMSTEEGKEAALEELRQKFYELDTPITPKEEFSKKYNEYKQNWGELIK